MRPPPREEGRITKVNDLTSASEMVLKFIVLSIMLVETTHLTQVEYIAYRYYISLCSRVSDLRASLLLPPLQN